MYVEYALVVLLFKYEAATAKTMTTVGGFISEESCKAAGEALRKKWGDFYAVDTVCVQVRP